MHASPNSQPTRKNLAFTTFSTLPQSRNLATDTTMTIERRQSFLKRLKSRKTQPVHAAISPSEEHPFRRHGSLFQDDAVHFDSTSCHVSAMLVSDTIPCTANSKESTSKHSATCQNEIKLRQNSIFSENCAPKNNCSVETFSRINTRDSLFSSFRSIPKHFKKNLAVSWTVVILVILNLHFKTTTAEERAGLAAWERPSGMPKIASLEVMCGSQHMEVHLEFDSPFHGLVASKGMYGHEGCVYVPPRSGKNKFVFNIHYDKCGTKPDNHGKFYENTVVVQYDEELIEAWDEAKRLRCEWFNDYEKTATKTSPMVISDLEIVELNFHGDNVDCWMEIQEGKGPWAPPLTGIVPLGSTLTMVIAVKDPTGEFDMRVKDCDASDGQSGNILHLSDTDGCIVRPKLIGKFAKLKLDDGRATVLTYAFLSAFKFPDMLNVHLRCTVEICRHGCPDHCSKLPPPPGTHVADVHGQFSDNEPIAVQSQVSQAKVKPNSIEENEDGENEGPEEIPKEKPDIHREPQKVLQQHHHQQQQQQQQQHSSEELQQHQIQPQPQQPSNHPPHRLPHGQHPPQQHQGPPLRYPSQPPPEGFSQYPPQMMHPPPPRGYFGRGPHPPPGAPHPMPPGMFRQPPRKLIPPGLVRQRPDISPFQQHNIPNLRHQVPPNMQMAPVFPSQNMFRENMPPQEQAMLDQHRQQAERVQSMILPPEHKDVLNTNEELVARQGEPQKDATEEEEEVQADNENQEEEESQDDIKAEKMVQDKEESDKVNTEQKNEQPPSSGTISQPQALKGDPVESIEDDSLSAEKAANARRPVFPKGPRSLRQRRSVSGSTDTIGVQGTFRVVSQADLNFALNSTAPVAQPTVVLRGKMRSTEDLVYGICLPRIGFGVIFFGLGVAVLVAILIASFLAYAHYSIHHLQTYQRKRRASGPMPGLAIPPQPGQVLPFPVIIFKKMW